MTSAVFPGTCLADFHEVRGPEALKDSSGTF
jgi:hypothetical protein